MTPCKTPAHLKIISLVHMKVQKSLCPLASYVQWEEWLSLGHLREGCRIFQKQRTISNNYRVYILYTFSLAGRIGKLGALSIKSLLSHFVALGLAFLHDTGNAGWGVLACPVQEEVLEQVVVLFFRRGCCLQPPMMMGHLPRWFQWMTSNREEEGSAESVFSSESNWHSETHGQEGWRLSWCGVPPMGGRQV